jgi:hypothetical protein
MSTLKELAKQVPGVRRLQRALRGLYVAWRKRSNPTRYLFTDIFERRLWGDGPSVSGPGSDLEQTRAVCESLPGLFEELEIERLLDLPCGDFHWMSRVPLNGLRYVGADIVSELVRRNQARHAREGVTFEQLDLLRDPLPAADLILCRDCLVHFSFADIRTALERFATSGARYLLTTHFPGTAANREIETGDWRPLNLELAPFHLPPPKKLIFEACTLEGGAHRDKVLGLWRIAELAAPDARWRACVRGGSSS